MTNAEKTIRALKRSLRYPSEAPAKAKRGQKRSHADMKGSKQGDPPRGKVPVWNMLRPCNQVGGGFHLTRTGRLPTFVEKYLIRSRA